jgi:predicted GNAT family acetyltransferase
MAELEFFSDLGAFLDAVGPFLEAKEAENCLILGLIPAMRARPPKVEPFGYRIGDMAAFFSGLLLIVSEGPAESVEKLADHFVAKKWVCPGVVGQAATSEAFAKRWIAATGCRTTSIIRQRIYELREVDSPPAPRGSIRLATPEDEALLLQWSKEFSDEALPGQPQDLETMALNLSAKIKEGQQFIWEDDGRPVSMAAVGRPTRRSISIAPVYTPQSARRRGYATALTAGVSQHALDSGREMVVLYTDLENPTSNAIYMKIGFRPVADSRNYWFAY